LQIIVKQLILLMKRSLMLSIRLIIRIMHPVLIFLLIILFGLIPFGSGVVWLKYRNTIVLRIALIIFYTSMGIALVAFCVSHYGFKSLWLAIPSCLAWLLASNFFVKKFVQKPVVKATAILRDVSSGNFKLEISAEEKSVKNEIGIMYQVLDKTLEGLNTTAGFAQEIGNGNLKQDIELRNENDSLRIALRDMQEKLRDAERIKLVKETEDQKMQWTNAGLAKFGEILRKHNNIDEFAFDVIKNLVEYLNANQGGIFIKTKDENEIDILELKASIAYDRQKFIKKQIYFGEGLLGSCVVEKKSRYLTQIPGDYINITSGLGTANPRSLLIVPLIIDDKSLGVVEIASFKELQDFEIAFIEKISTEIASTLRNVEVNERTANLLERTQQQAEEMAAQEEEMRQNIEELQATQEESLRRSGQVDNLRSALDNLFLMVEYNRQGEILDVNELMSNLLARPRDLIIGNHFEHVFKEAMVWETISQEVFSQKKLSNREHMDVEGKRYEVLNSFTLIDSDDGGQNILQVSQIIN